MYNALCATSMWDVNQEGSKTLVFLQYILVDATCRDMFMCNSICIEWSMVCDGYPSCQGGSDENNCDTSKLAQTTVCIMVTVLLVLQ